MSDERPHLLPERAVHALSEFFRLESAGGILLIGAAVLALLFANSPMEEFYDGFRELPVQVRALVAHPNIAALSHRCVAMLAA